MSHRIRRIAVATATLALAGTALAAPASAVWGTSPNVASGNTLLQGPLFIGPLVDADGLLGTTQLGQFQQ